MKFKKLGSLAASIPLLIAGCGGGGVGGVQDILSGGDGASGGDAVEDSSATDADIEDRAREDPQGQLDQGGPRPDVVLADGMICVPGDTQCAGSNYLVCNQAGTDWEVTKCEEGTSCTPDGCRATECKPGESACDDEGRVIVCLPDGSGWGEPEECNDGWICAAGQCVEKACTDGEVQCAGTVLLTCKDGAWSEQPCNEGWICFKNKCVECFADSHCEGGMVCLDGVCTMQPLVVTTDALPDGQVGQPYAALVQAEGGDGSYAWSVGGGSLPDGLSLAADGTIAGTPTSPGAFDFTAIVTDGGGAQAQAELGITIHDQGLAILSKSPLPPGEEGTDYSFEFKASGGVPPYGWMILSGAVPAGLDFSYTGLLSGIPQDHGTFQFEVRAVDAGDPIQAAKALFELEIKVAPLVIYGDQEINLFLTKAIILPLITVVEGIPIPYNTQLNAKGGVKPYHWKEIELPSFIKTFLPKAGIPDGLTLSDSGKLSGAVTSTDQVMELNIPFLNFPLKGFFFMAEVKDSQDPQDSDQAIFLIPTVPISLGGGGLPF